MAGLRLRKKEELRNRIIDVGIGVFQTKGYERTTMADIAALADTAVGTCYNYFPSKAHLFYECVFFNREEIWRSVEAIDFEKIDDPVDVIMNLIQSCLTVIHQYDKQFQHEMIMVLIDVFSKEHKTPIVVLERFMEYRYNVLAQCKKRGLLAEDLDIKETMVCLFSIIIVQIMTYTLIPEMTVEQLYASLDRKIRLFFQNKTTHCS